jgi:hypothetical protein
VAPRDAKLFSEQDFAFAEANQDSLANLLNLGVPNGPASAGTSMSNVGSSGRVWGRVVGDLLHGSDPFHASGGGLDAGADVALGRSSRLGVAVGWEKFSLKDSEGSSANQNVVRVSLYGSQNAGKLVISEALAYAHAWDKTGRDSGLGMSDASRHANAFSGGLQVAAPLQAGGLSVTPIAGVLVSRVIDGSFAEHNANLQAFAVRGAETKVTNVSPFALLSLSHIFTTSGGTAITPDVQFGYRHDEAANKRGVTLIADDGTIFANQHVRLNPNSAVLSAGLSAHKNGVTGYIRYRASFASDWTNQTLTAGLRWAF